MDIIYIKREIELSSLLGEELPKDVKEIIDFFKMITFRYEKCEHGNETWYKPKPWYRFKDQWTIQFWEGNWKYSRFYYENWEFVQEKYGLWSKQISDLIKDMLELTLNRKVSAPICAAATTIRVGVDP